MSEEVKPTTTEVTPPVPPPAPAAGAEGKPAPEVTPPAPETKETPPPPPPAEVKYELKGPEGVALPEGYADQFVAAAKDAGLTPEQAQKLFERESANLPGGTAWQAQVDSWTESAKSDSEIGGKLFEESKTFAKKALEKYGSPEFVQYLESTGLGSHPDAIRVFSRVGRAMGNDVTPPPGKPVIKEPTGAQRIFTTMPNP